MTCPAAVGWFRFKPPSDLDDSMPVIPKGWRKKAGGSAEEYVKYPIKDIGYLYFARGRNELSAHCDNDLCNHGLCRTKRSLSGSAEKYTGRPVGFLVAWLFAGAEFVNDREAHQKLARREKRDDPLISFAERLHARRWVQANVPDVLAIERPLAADETDEPTHVHY